MIACRALVHAAALVAVSSALVCGCGGQPTVAPYAATPATSLAAPTGSPIAPPADQSAAPAPGTPSDGSSALVSAKIAPDTFPSIPILDLVLSQGKCVRLEKMPGMLAKLPDSDFRVQLGDTMAEGRRVPGAALTEWLVLATQYQSLCQLYGKNEHNADLYIAESLPMEEALIERSLKQRRCAFLASVDEKEAWPYEVRFGQELLRRDFNEAEITRQLWRSSLEEYVAACGSALSKRAQIRAETQIRRLDGIIGLDDPTLIELRSSMLTALEKGDEKKVLVYAKAVAEREAAIDSRRAADYEAKLASIEQSLRDQTAALANERAAVQAAVAQANAQPPAGAPPAPTAADKSANMAATAENIARTARATKTTVNIVRSLF